MQNTFQQKVKILEKDIIQVGKFLRSRFQQGPKKKNFKTKNDLVLSEDIESEKRIFQIIRKLFPEDSILGEEKGLQKKTSAYAWIVDPLDGTNNFAYGIPMYGISVARMHKSTFTFGLIYLPETQELIVAMKGRGARLNGKLIQPLRCLTREEAIILYDNQWNASKDIIKHISKIWPKVFSVRITGSAAYDIVAVAKGVAHARVWHKTKLVDFASAVAILSEIGGHVSDFHGRAVTEKSTEVVISCGMDHTELLRLLT